MSKKQKPAKLSAKLPPGRKKHHGGYAFLTTGRLPVHRKYVESYLTAAREQLIRDLGGEENLSAGQIILCDRVTCKLGVLRCIEEHVRETHVFQGNRLNSALSKNYLSYSNSIRLDLQALGIEKRQTSEVLDLGRYIQQKDAEAEAKAKAAGKTAKQGGEAQVNRQDQGVEDGDGKDKGSETGEIGAPGSTSSDIQDPEEVNHERDKTNLD